MQVSVQANRYKLVRGMEALPLPQCLIERLIIWQPLVLFAEWWNVFRLIDQRQAIAKFQTAESSSEQGELSPGPDDMVIKDFDLCSMAISRIRDKHALSL